ncbi:MAG TPA: hypothetical protein VM490_23935 [Armatimonadaceae bacterium]|nr:hypothetical protein [Armatimonadaceae bacterium]
MSRQKSSARESGAAAAGLAAETGFSSGAGASVGSANGSESWRPGGTTAARRRATGTDRLVAEKLEKGYRPVTAAEARCARPVPVARRRAAVPPARQLSLPFADPADAPAPDKNPVSAAEPTAAAPLSLALDF